MARFVLRLVTFSQQFRRKERATEQEHTHSKGLGIKLKLNFYNLEIIGKSYFLQKKRSFALKP